MPDILSDKSLTSTAPESNTITFTGNTLCNSAISGTPNLTYEVAGSTFVISGVSTNYYVDLVSNNRLTSSFTIGGSTPAIVNPNVAYWVTYAPDIVTETPSQVTCVEFKDASTLSSESRENGLNRLRLAIFKREFVPKLLETISQVDFEYGVDTVADAFLRAKIKENVLFTKNCLNDTLLRYYDSPSIVCGILRLIARIDYFLLYPEGPTMALAALTHTNVEVQECGVRAFEHWATVESLHILAQTRVDTPWLQEYIDEVVASLEKENAISS